MLWLIFLAPIIAPILLNFLFQKEFPVQTGIVVISGASTGIGRHAAIHLAENGYTVFAGVRKETDADSIRKLNINRLHPVILDVTKHDSCVNALETIKKYSATSKLPIVGLVNNAGVSRKFPAEIHELRDIRRVYDTNFFGMIDLTQTFLPTLRETKGRIVMISSIAGRIVPPMSSIYSSSKFAVEGYSDGLRREVESFGVSVSLVEPGYVKSSIFATSSEESVVSEEYQDIVEQYYQQYYDQKAQTKRANTLKLADEPIVTTTAIFHAISSPHPKTRYLVANVDGIPAVIVDWIGWLLPDRLMDKFFAR